MDLAKTSFVMHYVIGFRGVKKYEKSIEPNCVESIYIIFSMKS